MVDKYAENGGAFYYADDVDDLYERTYNWSLFYAMGADKQVFNLALQQWHATTRFFSDDVISRKHTRFRPQIHNEYYNLATPGGNEWHHKGEGNMAFYHFGLADPTISENVRRSRRYAAMYMGDDSEAPNYDNQHKIFRCPMQTSIGPMHHATVKDAIMWLQGGSQITGQGNTYYGARATLYPLVKNLEADWFKTPQRRDEILNLFDEIVLKGDVPNSLGSTALMTNAYLYTGEDKYRRWVLDYTEAWINRMQRNNGIMPDNVGPNNQIGEKHEGQWWGGLFGWNSFLGHYIMFTSLTIAAECALLLTGDFGYLDLLRSQIKVLLENAITRSDGQLVLPTRYGLNGWEYDPYEWDSLNFNLDITDNIISVLKIQASNNVGDTLQLQVEQESNGSFYIPVCEGSLKQTKLSVQPFFIKKRGDYFHLPQLMAALGDGIVNLTGNYKDITHYELTGKLESINLNNIYSIIGQSSRINGLLKTGNISIEMDGSHSNPLPIFFSEIELDNGSIDDIQFNNLILSASYRNNRVLVNNFLLETQLGSIRGDGWFNYNFLSGELKYSDQDKLDLSFFFENIDLVKFNRYLPWGLESRGFISNAFCK